MATQYSGNQWLLIDLASMYGLDKKTFDERLDWGRGLLPIIQRHTDANALAKELRPLIVKADEPEMFSAVLIAIFDSLNNNPSGYTVGLDAASSGPQLLSLLTRCITGMENTGAIFNGKVPDLYSTILSHVDGFETTRKKVKEATVPHMYGSAIAPKSVFGKHVDGFLTACKYAVPRAEWARQKLIEAWDSNAYHHEWMLPDGGVSRVPVIAAEKTTGKFTDLRALNGKGNPVEYNVTFKHDVNQPVQEGKEGTKSVAANVTHSYDGYVLRELHRRCNYNPKQVKRAIKAIKKHLEFGSDKTHLKLANLSMLAERYNTVSVRAVEFIKENHMADISLSYLESLLLILEDMLEYRPFEIRSIHDEFACLPNNCNRMKVHFNAILVQAYESTWLMDTIEDLTGASYHHYLEPIDPTISAKIQENLYAIN